VFLTTLEIAMSLTKAQALAELETLRAHCARREAEWEAAQTELAALRKQIPAPKPVKPAYVRPAPAPEWLMRRAALDAAREQAMKEGRSVKAAL
jgi:hypothetical protein